MVLFYDRGQRGKSREGRDIGEGREGEGREGEERTGETRGEEIKRSILLPGTYSHENSFRD